MGGSGNSTYYTTCDQPSNLIQQMNENDFSLWMTDHLPAGISNADRAEFAQITNRIAFEAVKLKDEMAEQATFQVISQTNDLVGVTMYHI